MATNHFKVALEQELKEAGSTQGVSIKQARGEINDMLEQVRSTIDQELGDAGSARIEPWLSTNEGDGRRLIVSDSDGLEFQLFTVSVARPFGYPVTLRVRGDVSQAGDVEQLEDELLKVVKHPDVIEVVRHVIDGPPGQ